MSAVLATFTDCRPVKTRSQFQIVLEVPIENADEALRILGGVPLPGKERWVGVALAPKERESAAAERSHAKAAEKAPVQKGVKTERAGADRTPFKDLPLSTQAALRCNDRDFQNWITGGDINPNADAGTRAAIAAAIVREKCSVLSRADLDRFEPAGKRWLTLLKDFEAHRTSSMYGENYR